ncbi:hypothetical protein MOQ_006248 [Trypanosoma cruzi marinkellei]|uniref:Uncharacterized protein n=1 Tax=Trypanosoma cruzi marinkellei TaxID=85056 RepID=K2MW52_TRYCR|nr:hypothetical protein MOQ_006248 [Trypanosoma cruzi marinkellei]
MIMTLLSACIFFVGVLSTSFCARAAAISTKPCPTKCSDVNSWCSDVFSRGGFVSSGECEEDFFECTCNNASAIVVNRAGNICTWDGSFDPGEPEGNFCYEYTALCPTNCGNIGLWESQCANDILCEQNETGYSFNCTTCEGRLYSIVGDSTSCNKQFSSKNPNCDPLITCNGHGCCRKEDDPLNESPCVCFKDPQLGYWAPPTCVTCDDDYDPSRGNCTRPRPGIQKILSSIGTTWTMVLPNLAILFLFVVFGVTRAEFESDRRFQSAALRKTGLSAVQVARRQQRGLFHSKYIPKRPAQSRCFLNEGEAQTQRRGAPAY